eukprot:scaffold10178_cov129-Isochrysis_galbana.AAC.2
MGRAALAAIHLTHLHRPAANPTDPRLHPQARTCRHRPASAPHPPIHTTGPHPTSPVELGLAASVTLSAVPNLTICCDGYTLSTCGPTDCGLEYFGPGALSCCVFFSWMLTWKVRAGMVYSGPRPLGPVDANFMCGR